MKKALSILALAALAALPIAASIPDEVDLEDPGGINARQLIMFHKCKVTKIGENRTLRVVDEADGKEHEIKIGDEIKLRASSKDQFDGRKKLTFADLAVGQRVKVNVRKADGRILRIDVLPEKAD